MLVAQCRVEKINMFSCSMDVIFRVVLSCHDCTWHVCSHKYGIMLPDVYFALMFCNVCNAGSHLLMEFLGQSLAYFMVWNNEPIEDHTVNMMPVTITFLHFNWKIFEFSMCLLPFLYFFYIICACYIGFISKVNKTHAQRF